MYNRLSSELSKKLTNDFKKLEQDLKSSLKHEANKSIMEGLRTTEKTLLLLGSGLEDCKISQEQNLDEITKLSTSVELMVERNREDMD